MISRKILVVENILDFPHCEFVNNMSEIFDCDFQKKQIKFYK